MSDLIEKARAAWKMKREADRAIGITQSRESVTNLLRRAGILAEDEILPELPFDAENCIWEHGGLYWKKGDYDYHGAALMQRCPHCDDPKLRQAGTCKSLSELGMLLERENILYPPCPCQSTALSIGDQLAELITQIATDAAE